ncbi:MAG TPA: hypothetical protein VE262_15565 [Blastocatellia bacterium]|nr:hypothetical protein [Blastocatellia bacterium]
MSYKMKMALPILGMAFVFGMAAISVVNSGVEEVDHPLPASISRLADVKVIEVRDSGEQVVLSGNFSDPVTLGNEVKRKAALTGTSVDPDAAGRAEIEVETKNDVTEQELELDVERLAPGGTFKLYLDGQEAASFTTNHEGRAEVEVSDEPSK